MLFTYLLILSCALVILHEVSGVTVLGMRK